MPIVTSMIAETTAAVRRPVVMSAIDALKRQTGIKENVQVQDVTDINSPALPGSKMVSDNREKNLYDGSEKLRVTHTEVYQESDILTASVAWMDKPAFFEDPTIDVKLWPVYARADISIDVQYRAPNEAAAKQWVADILQRMTMERGELALELAYSFQIPVGLLPYLAHFHELRENVAGYGQTPSEWIRAYSDERVVSELTMISKAPQLAVAERQGRVFGHFDFSSPPAPDRNDTNATWTVSFTFKFSYDKPIAVAMRYPVVIHNQLIAKPFRKGITPYAADGSGASAYTTKALDTFIYRLHDPYSNPNGGIVVPTFDDWNPKTYYRGTGSVFTCLIQVDPTDPYQVINLRDLGGFTINPDIMAFIRNNKSTVRTLYKSPVLITLYSGKTPFPDEGIYIDEHDNVRSRTPLDLRKVHHFRISVLMDLSLLTEEYTRRLQLDGKAALQIVKCISPGLEQAGLLPRLRGGKMIAPLDWVALLNNINTTDKLYYNQINRPRLTVGAFLIEAGVKPDATI